MRAILYSLHELCAALSALMFVLIGALELLERNMATAPLWFIAAALIAPPRKAKPEGK